MTQADFQSGVSMLCIQYALHSRFSLKGFHFFDSVHIQLSASGCLTPDIHMRMLACMEIRHEALRHTTSFEIAPRTCALTESFKRGCTYVSLCLALIFSCVDCFCTKLMEWARSCTLQLHLLHAALAQLL